MLQCAVRGQSLDWLRPSVPFARSGGVLSLATSAQPHPAVARITVQERDGIAFGSGTLVDAQGDQGLVITNWHVVRDAAGDIEVAFPCGHRSKAKLIKTDKDWDLAALVIWKPNVATVSLSTAAPQPGDVLTIAGYGSGNFPRGHVRCTQYVSPGGGLPYEMVEMACEARQGDSGGPILNDRGEIAGVLFGAGGGTTSGSYVGRVKTFLASVSPRDVVPPSNVPAASSEHIASTNPFVNPQGVPYLVHEANARVASSPPKVSLEKPSTSLPVEVTPPPIASAPPPAITPITPLADEMEALPSTAPRTASSSHLVTFGALPDRAEYGDPLPDAPPVASADTGVPLWSRPLPNNRPSVSSATNEALSCFTRWQRSPPRTADRPRRTLVC